MKFSLIICGYNEEKNIDACIKSCLEQNYPNDEYEIIYVDNNSKDKSLELAKKYPIICLTEIKQGLSEARNCGINNSKGEILVFLDVDLKLDKDYLKNHEKTFESKIVGAGGGKVLPIIKTWVSNYLGVSLFEGYPRFLKNKYVRTYPGCNLTIRKSVLKKVGLFKEGLITSEGITRFAEDKDICERIREADFKILYNSKAIVYHKNTYNLKQLIKIWFKGAKGRVAMIKLEKKDPFSLLFKYNLPIFSVFLFSFLLFININLSLAIFLLFIVISFSFSFKLFIETGMFFQSFFIKPWMDIFSILIINFGVVYNKIKK